MPDDTNLPPAQTPAPIPPVITVGAGAGGLPPAQPPGRGLSGWAIALIAVSCLLCLGILVGLLLPALARAQANSIRIACVNNLKVVGFSFRQWANDHGDEFPFNVSTNKGGTFELCAPGPDGFDRNSWMHFRVMSNELGAPILLVCPHDRTTLWVNNYAQLQASNVTYLVHSGTNINEKNPQSVLAICPFHHNVLFSDGSVRQLTEADMQKLLASPQQPR